MLYSKRTILAPKNKYTLLQEDIKKVEEHVKEQIRMIQNPSTMPLWYREQKKGWK